MFDLVSPHFFVHPKTKKNIKPTTNPSFPAATQKAETLAMEFNAINNQIGKLMKEKKKDEAVELQEKSKAMKDEIAAARAAGYTHSCRFVRRVRTLHPLPEAG